MLDRASEKGPEPVVVAAANVVEVLIAASRAYEMGIISDSILIGDSHLIESLAREHHIDFSGFKFMDGPDDSGSARRAMELAAQGEAIVVVEGQMETSRSSKQLYAGALVSGQVVQYPTLESSSSRTSIVFS